MPLKDTAFLLSDGNAYSPTLLSDVVFTRRDETTGIELFSFALREITKEANIHWEELAVDTGIGQAGQGIWMISGDIILSQNSTYTINNIQQHLGRTFEIHELYFNTDSVHSAYVQNGKRITLSGSGINDGSGVIPALTARFNNIEAYRNQFGVVLSLVDETLGARSLHVKISGATAEKINIPGSGNAQDFYNAFTTLKAPPTTLSVNNAGGGS